MTRAQIAALAALSLVLAALWVPVCVVRWLTA